MIIKISTHVLAALVFASPMLATPGHTSQAAATMPKTGVLTWCKENPCKLALGLAVGGIALYWLTRADKSATQARPAGENKLASDKAFRMSLSSTFQAYMENPETAPVENIPTLYPEALADKNFAQLYQQFKETKTQKRDKAGQIVAYLKSFKK